MPGFDDHVVLAGKSYVLVDVVEHVADGSRIVLCRDDTGALRFVHAREWHNAAVRPFGVDPSPHDGRSNLAPVTHESPWDEKVSLVMSLFRGRTDVYAEGYVGRGTKPGKLSYWPPCGLRWERGVCPRLTNPKARCSDCDHPSYIPLTKEVISAHCKGERDRRGRIRAVGIYVVDGDICHLLAADFDGPGWQEAASAYRDTCRRHGLSPAVERSRSGNGAHVWVFFDGPVKASLARLVGEGLVSEARETCAAVSFRSYDRLFPLQDSVSPGSLGSLIALPLQGEAVREGNSVFVDDQFMQLPDQCAYLSTIPKSSPVQIAAIAEGFGKDPIGLPDAKSRRLVMGRPHSDEPTTVAMGMQDEGVPSIVQVTLSDGVRIACSGLPARVTNRLRRLAAFRNPEYTKKLRMHFSVWDIPRIVDLGVMDSDELVLPRGCVDSALSILREASIEPFVADGRAEGRRIHARFLGELRPVQRPCRDKLVKHDLGVLVAPTGFGKSVIAASIIAAHQVSTLVIVPNTALLAQWRESLAKFLAIDDEPPVLLTPTGRKSKHQPGVVGVIGGGRVLRSGIIDVALAGSLFEKGEVAGDSVVSPFVREYGMVIVDEAQHVAASKVHEVLKTVRAHYVYAMTATPKREDGLDRILFLECGPLRHEVSVSDQVVEQGMRRLLIPRFSTSHPNLEVANTWHAIVDYVSADEERNHLVVSDAVRALRYARTPLVLTRRVEHARILVEQIDRVARSLGAHVALLVGADSDALRRQRLEDLRHASPESPLCVVATGSYVGEGFDLDRLDTLLLAGPVAFEGALAQWVGRLHRVRDGKSSVVVIDYVDPAIPMLDKEWRGRLRAYKKLGYEMADDGGLGLVGLEGRREPVGHLFGGKEFAHVFEDDLRDCGTHAIIASSWTRFVRVKALRGALGDAVGRGVSVIIVLRKPAKPSSEFLQVSAMLRDLGCEVHVISGAAVSDIAVIDGSLVWFGSVAPLAFPRKDDCSLRFVSQEVAVTLSEAIGQQGD